MADIVLKNANGTPVVYNGVTKIKVPTSDGGTTIYTEGASGGGIEEVTELPEATAENVGKIYKYQGELYECKEYKELFYIIDMLDAVDLNYFFTFGMEKPATLKMHYVDSEPSVEDMLPSDMANLLLELYVLNDGTDVLIALDLGEGLIKMSMSDPNLLGVECCGISNKYPKVDESNGGLYLIHFYYLEQQNVTNMLWGNGDFGDRIIRVPKTVHSLTKGVFSSNVISEVIFEGNIYSMYAETIFENMVTMKFPTVKIVDLSKVEFVPRLATYIDIIYEGSSIIKVPQALLEEFKSATNWSEYADLMVGV